MSIVILLTVFIGVRLIVSTINFLSFPFPPRRDTSAEIGDISILIPARNEEENIGRLLDALVRFEEQPLEILVYDDCSTDRTAETVLSYKSSRSTVGLIRGETLPAGWLGKNHACRRLASLAKGNILLFLDADVQIKEGVLQRTRAYFEKFSLDLLSIFPKQQLRSFGERLSVPLMNWILLSLLPLTLIRRSKNPVFAAANGQFMMFRAQIYRSLQPHEIHKANQVEDIAILRYYKKKGYSAATLLGDDTVQCRMYHDLGDAISGFGKNVFQFFGGSILVTVGFGLVTTLAPIYILWQAGFGLAYAYLAAVLLIRLFVSLTSRQNALANLVLLLPQHFVFLFIIIKAIKSHYQKELLWKERNILKV